MTSNDEWLKERAGEIVGSALKRGTTAAHVMEENVVALVQEAKERGKMKGWRCFHCDEHFADAEAACAHFGAANEAAQTACQIDIVAVREMEMELARYRAEDSDADREFYRLRADHATALKREEQLGYDRGLADAREMQDKAVAAERESMDLRQWLRESADQHCNQCDGTGIFYGNVHICMCICKPAAESERRRLIARLANPDEALVEAFWKAYCSGGDGYIESIKAGFRALARTLTEGKETGDAK